MDLKKMLISGDISDEDSFDSSSADVLPHNNFERLNKDVIVIDDSGVSGSSDIEGGFENENNEAPDKKRTVINSNPAVKNVPKITSPLSNENLSDRNVSIDSSSGNNKRPQAMAINSDSNILGTPASKKMKTLSTASSSNNSKLLAKINIAEQLAQNRKKANGSKSRTSTPPLLTDNAGKEVDKTLDKKMVAGKNATGKKIKTTSKSSNPGEISNSTETNNIKTLPAPKKKLSAKSSSINSSAAGTNKKKLQSSGVANTVQPKKEISVPAIGSSASPATIPLKASSTGIQDRNKKPDTATSTSNTVKAKKVSLIKKSTPSITPIPVLASSSNELANKTKTPKKQSATADTALAKHTTTSKTPAKTPGKLSNITNVPQSNKKATQMPLQDPEEKIGSPKVIVGPKKQALNNKKPSATSNGIVVVDIPLYNSESNDYLDENGQVVFNYASIINQYTKKDTTQVKKNLLDDLEDNEEMDDEAMDDDLGDDDDDDLGDESEEMDDSNNNSTATGTGPNGKKPHPTKGKSRIGKYDIEDPFIDDTELLWENQRAATKDGFFVFFGPLIEKGHYASFERIDGTMKKGGIRSNK